MNRNTMIIAVLVISIASLVAYWFFDTFEHRVEEKEVGFHGEARRNNFLAAERFLEKFGMQIQSLPTILDLKDMPDTNDVLFIPTGRYDLAPEKIDELLDWVRAGGHLIVRARRPTTTKAQGKDELLDRLGVEVNYRKKNLILAGSDYKEIKVHVNEQTEDKQVTFNANVWLLDNEVNTLSWQVTGEDGSHLLEYNLGQGWVTVLSDIAFLHNNRIDEFDHASFLYTVVHIDNSKRNLWIIRHDDMPSLWSIMWQRAPQAIMIFGLFLVFWLWYVTRRFGPLIQPERLHRRSLREHITSSGFYQWRNNNRTELFQSARLALQEQIAMLRPLWAKLDNDNLAGKLARTSGLPKERILQVLKTSQVEKESDFAQLIETLSVIRKKL